MPFDIGKLLGLDKIERIVAKADRPPVVVDAGLCLRARGGLGSACDRCIEICPAGALEAAGPGLEFAADKCVECGICAGVCPAGVFATKKTDDFIVASAKAAASGGGVVFTCPKSGYSGRGLVEVPCLGRLSLAHLAAAAALGAKTIHVADSACEACAWQAGFQKFAGQMQLANELFSILGSDARVTSGVGDLDEATPAADMPAEAQLEPEVGSYSRRDFLTKIQKQAVAAGVQTLAGKLADFGGGDKAPYKYKLPRSRELLLASVAKLASHKTGVVDRGDLPFGQIEIGDQCIFCRNCTMFCPTGALQMIGDGKQGGRIEFCLASCTMCGLCEAVCPPQVVRFADTLELDRMLAYRAETAITYEMYTCRSCGQQFAATTEGKKCGFCKLREKKLADDF